jgi:hypothetical protein
VPLRLFFRAVAPAKFIGNAMITRWISVDAALLLIILNINGMAQHFLELDPLK